MTTKEAREMAMAFEAATEAPHFEKISFRVNKKIFLTIDESAKRACVTLNVVDQDVYTLAGKGTVYPVPNKWGQQGWTFIDLPGVNKKLFKEVLTCSYCKAAPKKLAQQYLP